MGNRTVSAGFQPVRRDQLFQEREHDSYKLRQKPAEPTVCPDCGAVFHRGRWQWGEAPSGAAQLRCAACHRIHDRFPAGFVRVGGAFFAGHRDELTALLRHHGERARSEHPMSRIIAMEPDGDGLLVTTTDIHLARDLGDALHDAYQGDLEYHYNEAEKLLRVGWQR